MYICLCMCAIIKRPPTQPVTERQTTYLHMNPPQNQNKTNTKQSQIKTKRDRPARRVLRFIAFTQVIEFEIN